MAQKPLWLPAWESPLPDPLPKTLGPKVAKWMQRYLVHGEGDAFGKPFRLMPWQKYLLSRVFEVGEDGRWLHRRVVIMVPKGNSKSELTAAMGLALMAGPVAPESPNIPVAAASFEQANRLFGAARTMVVEGPLKTYFEAYETELRLKDAPGVMTRVAAVAGTNDGGLPTAFLADEVHEWLGSTRERVYTVIGNSLAKRANGISISISTAGGDRDTLLGRLYDHGVKVATGEVDDPEFLFMAWQPSRDWDLDDDEQLEMALLEANPAAHEGGWLDIANLKRRFRDANVPRHEAERYHLNRWAEAPETFIKAEAWAACGRVLPPPPPGTPIVMAFDGSYQRDTTAIVASTLEGHLFVVGHWEPTPGEPVPRDEVDARVAWAMKQWKVEEFACDPPGWHTEVAAWQAEFGAEVVTPFDTMVGSIMAPATDRFRADVEQGVITHDGNPALARHIANCRTKETRWGLVVRKESKDSPKRIDLAVAAIVARHRALDRVVEATDYRFISLD